MTAPARFKQADLGRLFKAARKAEVRVAGKVLPTGEIEFRMLTDAEAEAHGKPNKLERYLNG